MIKSLKYVISENIHNLFRIFSIARYELLADMRESKLGIVWNVLNPLISILTYGFVFGLGIRGGKPVNGIAFFDCMIAGVSIWFMLSPCITGGVNAIYSKRNIINKMKFPISILPATVVLKETFNHLFMLAIVYITLIARGMKPSIYNLQIIYFLICAMAFSISLSMVTSVLNMFTRDVKKMVSASMRMLMYLTPILWTMEKLPHTMQIIMKLNPLYYIVEGYRDSFFYHGGLLLHYKNMIWFWFVVVILFSLGSILLHKNRHKFIDLI